MSDPNRLPIDMLLQSDAYRDRLQAKRQVDTLEAARLGAAMEPQLDPANPDAIDDYARTQRAADVVHRMDIGAKAGPDAIQGQLHSFERTADPTGKTPVGLSLEDRRKRIEALKGDEKLVTFFERNPEAAFLLADDDSLLDGAAQLLRDVINKPFVVAGAYERSRLQKEKADAWAEFMTKGGSSPEERASALANAKRIDREIARTQGQPESKFDRFILETMGSMIDTTIVDPIAAGLRTTRVTVPVTIAAGAAGGAVLFGAPTGGVGAAPGAGIGATTLTAIVTPVAFGIGAVSSMFKRSTGNAYGEYVMAGEDPDALSTKLAATAFGTVETAIEFAGAGVQWKALGKPILARALPGVLRKSVQKEALDYFANPTRMARAMGWLKAAAKSAGAEGGEEFAQAVFSNAVADATLRAGQGKPIGAILDEVLSELPQNAIEGAQEGASVFASMMLTGGLFAPLAAYRANKEITMAEDDKEFFDAWGAAESSTKLIKRSPRLAGEFLGILTEGTDRSTVYVDPDILQGALNSEAIPAEEANAVMPGVTQRIQDAKEQGRRVAIPAREFASVVSNSKLMPHIRPHLTSQPAGLTNAQRLEAQKKSMEEIGLGDLAKEKDDVLAVQAMLDSSAGEVGMRIADQLSKSGFRDEKTAETEGMIVRDRVRALAAQVSAATGRLYTPEEVFNVYPLNVLSKEQVQAIREGKVEGATTLGPEVVTLASPSMLEDDQRGEVVQDSEGDLVGVSQTGSDTFAEQHVLATQRQQRAVAQKVTWQASEKDAIAKAEVESGAARGSIAARVRSAKIRFPAASKWLPLVFERTEAKLDDNGDPVVGADGKPVMDIVWKKQPYTFDRGKNGKALAGEERAKAVRALARDVLREVRGVAERAKRGDREARVILRQADWYRAMRQRLRHEFGGLGDLFANLLGALSPKTPVKANWKNAITALRAATAGEFDALMPQWEAWQQNIDEAEAALREWIDGQISVGWTVAALRRTPQFRSLLRELGELRQLPDELNPRKPNGTKYGSNGRQLVKAMVGLWRVVKNPDPAIGRGATAPKAQNFSGNLIGFRSRATIDVWAARFLQRLRWGNKVPPAAEGSVAGEARADGNATGPFGFGQDVFTASVELIRQDPDLQQFKEMQGINDDDLQALVWFIEKEIWTQDDATSTEGEGGSFEFEADLTGSSQQDRIADLRQIMNAKDSTAAEKLAASAELDKLKRTVDRFVAGVSLETSAGTQGVSFVPDDAEMAAVGAILRDGILSTDPGAKVVGVKTASTVGLYGAPERSFDVEVVATEGFDPSGLKRTVWTTAKDNLQDSAFVSRVLRAGEDIDYTRHRPGVEVFFSETKPMSEIEGLLARLSEAVGGYTVIVDALRSGPAVEGAMPPVVGIRAQYIPEFDARYGDETLVGADDAQIASAMEAKAAEYIDKIDALLSLPGVSMAQVVWHETDVRFEGEYDAALKEIDNADAARRDPAIDREAGIERPFGRSVAEGVAAAARRASEERARRDTGTPLFDRPARRAGDSGAKRTAGSRLTEVLNQLVFHGTPSWFKKFDISFIGTGEGAQAFGWGLYFTSSQGIARFYRDKLSGARSIRDIDVKYRGVEWRQYIEENFTGSEHENDRDRAKAAAIERIAQVSVDDTDAVRSMQEMLREQAPDQGQWTAWPALAEEIMALDPADFEVTRPKPAGMVAAVHIPDQHDLAIWELPISKQDPKVREGIKRAFSEFLSDRDVKWYIDNDIPFMNIVKDEGHNDARAQFISESLAANGVLGHSYTAQTTTGRRVNAAGESATNYVIYDDKAISEVVEILESSGKQASDGPRAQIALKEKEAYAAVLTASDLTGFQHELAHWYLQQLVVFRQLGLASEQMNRDLDAVVAWTGAESWEHLTRPLVDRVFQGKADKPHELFARGFEVWLAEGKAPTPEMQGIFLRFKAWVRQAYGGIRQTRERLGIDLTDEIRGVYDRLFLIEAAVEEAAGDIAEPLFPDRPEGWTDAQWAAYQKAWVRHKSEAFTRVTRRHLPDAKRRMREQLAQAMELFRTEAEQQVAADPGWAAIEWLKRSEEGQGLDRAGLEEILGSQAPGLIEALLGRPAQGRGRKLVVADGIDPEWAAEALGFGSAGDMVEAMLQARTVDQIVQERVNREIEGNDQWSEESVTAEAEAAAGADREALALAELAALRQMAEGPALDEARTAQAATGAPAAPDAQSDVALAEASLAEAVSSGASEQAIADLQALVVNARAAREAAREGRKQARVAGQTLRAIEERLRAGILRGRARELVGDILAGDLRKERHAWAKVAATAGKAARKALAARKFADAAVEIERQLLADYAVAELNRTMEESERGWRMLDRLKRGKNLAKLRAPGFDGAAQIVKLMQRYDLRKSRPGRPEGLTLMGAKLQKVILQAQQAEGLQSLAEFVRIAEEQKLETISVPDWLLAAEADTRHWSKMPISEFLGLIDVIRNIETASKQEVEDIHTREKVGLETAVDMIERRVLDVNDLRNAGKSSRPNPLSVQAIKDMIRWADAMLLRVVDWIDFAGGDDIVNNTLRRFVFEPIDQGEHNYIDMSNELTKPWMMAMDKLDWRRMNREIELRGVDPSATPNTPTKVRVYEVFMWFLHSGTESNLYRRDQGYAGNEDLAGWTPMVMDQAIKQHLTPEDLKVAQEIWDAFEGLRGRIFEHEFQMTGNRPTALERREFIAHTGDQMRGGYMPAKYDSRYSKRAQALNDKADIEGMFGHNFVKAEVEHGHVKSRAEKYSAPLDTNIGIIGQHLDRVIYDLAMRKAVRDVYKIVNHPRFESLIRKTWGAEYLDALKKMVHDAARVKSGRPSDGWRKAETINSWARSSVIYSGLAYRISTGLIQVTGLAPVFSEVGPTYALMAIANSTRKGVWGLVRETREVSRVLQHRGITKDRELREMLSNKRSSKSLKSRIDANTGLFIVTADAVVSSIAWDAQRMKSMAEHGDMKRAVREADRAIERTQGSSTIAGASQLMRAEGWVRWVTLFGSFTSNIYARVRRAGRLAAGLQATRDVGGKGVRKKMPAAATGMLIATIYVPAMLDAIIRAEGPPEDDEGEKNWLSWSIKRFVSLLASPVPGVTQLVDGMLFEEKRRFVGKSPTSRMFDVPIQAYDELRAVFDEDEQFDPEKLTLLAMQGLTMAKVAPLSQAEIWVDNFWPGEEMGSPRDLIWRKPKERRE